MNKKETLTVLLPSRRTPTSSLSAPDFICLSLTTKKASLFSLLTLHGLPSDRKQKTTRHNTGDRGRPVSRAREPRGPHERETPCHVTP